jgi:hypothetical protein
MMAATLAIWRQPVAERRAAGSLWLSWLLLVLGVLGTATAASDAPRVRLLFVTFTGVPIGMLLIMWWLFLCGNVKAQCHPAALQLVPALRARMVRAVVLAWLAIVAVMTLLVGVPLGLPVQVALFMALLLIEMSFAGTWRSIVLWASAAVLPQVLPTAGPWLAGAVVTPAGLAAAVLLVLVDGAAALRRLPGASVVTAGWNPGAAAWLGTGGCPPGWLDRAADRQPAFLQPLGRSWFGAHWTTIAVVIVACSGLRIWASLRGPAAADFLHFQRMVVAAAMPCLLALFVGREAQRFAKARTEQALLALTPGAPGSAVMNRLLAVLLVRGFTRSWLILGGLMLAVLALQGAPAGGLARMCAMWMAALPLVTVAMRDFARAGGMPGLLATPLMTFLIWAGAVGVHGAGAPAMWLGVAAAGLVSALVLARWRWNVMLAAPPALPAGRVQDKRWALWRN